MFAYPCDAQHWPGQREHPFFFRESRETYATPAYHRENGYGSGHTSYLADSCESSTAARRLHKHLKTMSWVFPPGQPLQHQQTRISTGMGAFTRQGLGMTTMQAMLSMGGTVPTQLGSLLLQRPYVAVGIVTLNAVAPSVYGSQSLSTIVRVTLVDVRGTVILDSLVQPIHTIPSHELQRTGLSPLHLQHGEYFSMCAIQKALDKYRLVAPSFRAVQSTVASLIFGKTLVGHRLWDFLSFMGLSHPAIDTRDFALFRPLRKRLKSRFIVDLATLVGIFVGRNIGSGYINSLEHAAASLDLFRVCYQVFEGRIQAGSWPCDLPPISCALHYL
ncbi:hypothetical protein BKA70DRAFT_1382429 [Coprinopsis sp. MPI-PUGE-AT-0042]|nr:hypothetical protein BKA70DRAFT_1382429 [Coprinopsis sp. MPI-PUGE-AT-0042]